jgi:SNF2 family DNA or RNA helicase
MIIDEAHKIKNEESIISMNVRSFNWYFINN